MLYTVILLGALQGFIMGFLLFFSKYNRTSGRLLAIILWLMALASLNVFLDHTGWYYTNTTIAVLHALVPMVVIMPIGPLIYLYSLSVVDRGFRIEKKHYVHFLPVIVDIIPSCTAGLYLIGVSAGLIMPDNGSWGIFIDQYNVYSDLPRWISLTTYLLIAAKSLRRLDRVGKDHGHNKFKWLRQFFLVYFIFQCVWLVYLIPYIIPAYTDTVLTSIGWYPVYVPMAAMIYWLGINGYVSSLLDQASSRKSNAMNLLAPDIVQAAVISLKRSMEEDNLYLDPELSLAVLSSHTGIAQKTVSAVLNQHLQKSFSEFVNHYRVEAFKRKLQQPEVMHLTIAGVASQCGFGSKASFQRIFKEVTGTSPMDFQKKLTRGLEEGLKS